jgi:hypothetical protein
MEFMSAMSSHPDYDVQRWGLMADINGASAGSEAGLRGLEPGAMNLKVRKEHMV